MNRAIFAVAGVLGTLVLGYFLACFQVAEWEQAVLLQFGRPIRTIIEPGLNFKIPFIQKVEYFERRLLVYDASPRELITRDKQQLVVDNYSRWKITDPLKFYQTVVTINGAQSRLDDIIYSNLREAMGRMTLRDIVSGDREGAMKRVTEESNEKAAAYGVEIIDVRIKRADLPEKNEQTVFSRMKTERERQAKMFRAEGDEEARKIRSTAEKTRMILLAEANREAEIIRGEAEAGATKVYAAAYEKNSEFYAYMRTLEAYRRTLSNKTTMILDPSSEFLERLSSSR
jgi:membrane protease subunit HflC